MAVSIKICGLTSVDAAVAAGAAGADFAGFIFFPRSPRHVTPERAGGIAAALPDTVQRVAVTVNADDRTLDEIIIGLAPDFLQLHGSEPPERVAEVKARTGLPVIRALGIGGPADVEAARRFEAEADILLFDSKPEALPGGNGVRFDWGLVGRHAWSLPWWLAGGLDPETVAEAIRMARPTGVDVSSGVESAPGVKDPARICAFVKAARSAAPR